VRLPAHSQLCPHAHARTLCSHAHARTGRTLRPHAHTRTRELLPAAPTDGDPAIVGSSIRLRNDVSDCRCRELIVCAVHATIQRRGKVREEGQKLRCRAHRRALGRGLATAEPFEVAVASSLQIRNPLSCCLGQCGNLHGRYSLAGASSTRRNKKSPPSVSRARRLSLSLLGSSLPA